MKKVVLFFLSLFFAQWVYAQETYDLDSVIVASRTKENMKSIGKVVYKIDTTDLVKFAGQSFAQALNTVPGVEINNAQGNFGSNLGYYVRGGRNKDVLIMIDGVPVGDPSQINYFYDLNLLPLEQVQSIEVIKGGNSALYGSNASAGVISITLKKNSKKKIEANLGLSGGSFGTLQQNLQLSGALGKFNYNITGNNFKTDGFSAAFGNNFEKDGAERQNIITQLGFNPTKDISLKAFFQLNNQKYGFDTDSFTDNTMVSAELKEIAYGLQSEIKNLENKGHFTLNSRVSEFDRNTGFGINNSRNYFVGLTQNYEVNKSLKLVTGAEFNIQNQTISDLSGQLVNSAKNAEFDTTNPYVGAVVSVGDFNLIANGRLNFHSNYDNKFVYSITPSYLYKVNNDYSVSAKGSISTAYITPTLFQLFGDGTNSLYSTISSPELNPQESITYEAGLSFYHKNNITLNSTFFYREDSSPIIYTFGGAPLFQGKYSTQLGQFNTKGLEVDLKVKQSDKITFGSAYTYTYVDRNLDIRRIPMNKLSSFLTLNNLLTKDNSISIIHTYTSARTDAFYDATIFGNRKVNLNPYNLLSLSISQKADDHLTFNFMLNNILNHDYFESVGYSTRKRNFTLGLTANF